MIEKFINKYTNKQDKQFLIGQCNIAILRIETSVLQNPSISNKKGHDFSCPFLYSMSNMLSKINYPNLNFTGKLNLTFTFLAF